MNALLKKDDGLEESIKSRGGTMGIYGHIYIWVKQLDLGHHAAGLTGGDDSVVAALGTSASKLRVGRRIERECKGFRSPPYIGRPIKHHTIFEPRINTPRILAYIDHQVLMGTTNFCLLLSASHLRLPKCFSLTAPKLYWDEPWSC